MSRVHSFFKIAWIRRFGQVFLFLFVLFWCLKAMDLVLGYLNQETISGANSLMDHKEKLAVKDGYDFDALYADNKQVYGPLLKHHPYRWYSLPPNFKGHYTRIDSLGFRNDQFVSDGQPVVGCFGGSTMYSLYSQQEATIPAFLNQQDSLFAYNFGVGAYSSTTELFLLSEVIRTHRLKVAVFYDGANEIARYLEYLQSGSDASFYEVMGYPYNAAKRAARNEFRSGFSNWSLGLLEYLFPYTSQWIDQSADGQQLTQNANSLVTRKNASNYAHAIANIYLQNRKQIKAVCEAYGVTPVFIWQSHIYNSNKPFSTAEKAIQEMPRNQALSLLAKTVEFDINRFDHSGYHFIDMSNALDDQDSTLQFYDWCHLGKDGNARIAEQIFHYLRQEKLLMPL